MIIAAGLLLSPIVRAQDEFGLPIIRNYPAREYGAHAQNWCVIQDGHGIVYAGNNLGILEFDGITWQVIPVTNRTTVRSLAYDTASATLYAGAQGEFGYVATDPRGRPVFVSLVDRVDPADRTFVNVWRTWVTPDGVYFQTNTHIFRWHQNRMSVIRPASHFHFSFRARDRIFVTQQKLGLFELKGDSLSLIPEGDFFKSFPLYAVLPYGSRDLLILAQEGAFISDGSRVRPFAPQLAPVLKSRRVYGAIALADSLYALATLQGGVLIMNRDGTIRSTVDESSGLQNESVKSLFLDRQNGLWAALEKGLARIEYGSPVSRFNSTLNFKSQAESLLRHKGRLYAGTKDGLFTIEPADGGASSFVRAHGITHEVWSLLTVREYLLAATWGRGTVCIDGNRTSVINSFNAASLFRSRTDTNRVFIGLFDGLASVVFRNGAWVDEGRIPGIHDDIRFIAEETDGSLWVGHLTRGCSRVDLKNGLAAPVVTRYDTAAGLPDEGINVYMVDNRVYFGTESGVFYRYDAASRRFRSDSTFFNRFDIPPGRAVPCGVDDQGRVWFSYAPGGSNKAFPAAAVRQPDGEYVFKPLLGGRLETSFVGPFHVDTNDVVWFQSGDEIIRFDLRKDRASDRPFDVVVRKVLAAGDSVVYGGSGILLPPVLDFDWNSLKMEFAALSFDEPEMNRYRFRLEGFEHQWPPWSTEPHKEYTNLPEGLHRFVVQAMNVYGVESRPVAFEFRIRPPWYRTWWAYALYAAMFGAVGYVGIQWRLRLLRKRNEELEQNVEIRTRELESAGREIEAQRDHLKSTNTQLEAAIADLKSTQAQLIHSERMAAVGHMVAGLAHEINNPLTFIIPNLDYLKQHLSRIEALYELFSLHADRLSDNEDLSQRMTVLKQEIDEIAHEMDAALEGSINGSRRIKEIVVHLKTFTRHDAPAVIETDIEPHLNHAVDLFFTQHGDITFIRRFTFNRPLLVDIQELNQCFIHILINAVQAIRDAEKDGLLKNGAGRITLTTEGTELEGLPAVRVVCSDNGVGMQESIVAHIFDPFFTTRPVGSGHGLGLAETYAIVKKHGGIIDVRSEAGKGTEISIVLPIRRLG